MQPFATSRFAVCRAEAAQQACFMPLHTTLPKALEQHEVHANYLYISRPTATRKCARAVSRT